MLDRGARHGELGASAVEFAIVVPLFLMLVMGMIHGGIAFNHKLALSHGAREGARFGATLPTGKVQIADQWFIDIAQRAIDSAAGAMDPVVPGHHVCVAYVGYASPPNSTTDWTRKRAQQGSTVTYSNGSLSNPASWCFDDARGADGTERRVQVVMKRDTDFNVVLWGTTITITAEGVARYEAVTP